MNQKLKNLFLAKGIHVVGNKAYLPLFEGVSGVSFFELMIAQEIGDKIYDHNDISYHRRPVTADTSIDEKCRPIPAFWIEVSRCNSGDAFSIITALKSARQLFEYTIKVLAKRIVYDGRVADIMRRI